MEIRILLLFTQPERRESGDWDPLPVYTTREKGEWRLGSCFCLNNQREGRVKIWIPLLFTQPERRECGDWDPGSARSLLPNEGRILRVVRVAVTPPPVVRAVAERTAAGIRRVSLLDSFSFPCETTYVLYCHLRWLYV